MALGGGTFITQNKKLPGSYINFVSAQRASAFLSDRGVCALPLELNWGEANKVIEITDEDFFYNAKKFLGYNYDDDRVKGIRDLFKNAKKAYIYRLNGDGAKASCKYGTAKYGGIRGNDLRVVITQNANEQDKFDVKTLLDGTVIDEQKNATTTNDLEDNDFVVWNDGVRLELTASTPFTDGDNGSSTKASCKYGTAKVGGKDGNNLSIAVSQDVPYETAPAVKATCKYGTAKTAGLAGNNLKIKIENGEPTEKTPAKKATCEFGDAKTAGVAGNKLKVVVSGSSGNWTIKVNNTSSDVYTKQSYTKDTIAPADLTNDYVEFKAVALSAKEAQLSGGADAVMEETFNVITLNVDEEVDKQENVKLYSELEDNDYVVFDEEGEDVDLSVETVSFENGKDAETEPRYVVTTKYLGSVKDKQANLKDATGLTDNDWIAFNKEGALTAETVQLSGGAEDVTSDDWMNALKAFESFSFNILGIVSNNDDIKKIAIDYTDRLRDDVGVKFQTVLYNYNADNKGIINVVSHEVGKSEDPSLVYWFTGAEAGCQVNASLTNRKYDGDFDVDTNLSQNDLEKCIDKGQIVLHRVNDDVKVLTDINSKTTITPEEGEDFKSNQTIRVLDQIGNDIATIFNTSFLGIIPNDNSGRISFWNEVVKHHQELARLRAIENFMPEDVVVKQGQDKKSIEVSDAVTPTNALEKLYMTCVVN